MTPRAVRFGVVGAVVISAAALIYERTLPFEGYVYRRKNGPLLYQPARVHVVNGLFELSPAEAVVWFVIVGALLGGLVGVAIARIRRRKRASILIGAGLAGTVGFIVAVAGFDEFCIMSGDTGTCSYKSFLGWTTAPILAVSLWIAVGAVIGGVLGRLAAGVSRRD